MEFSVTHGRLNPKDPIDRDIIAANILVQSWMKDPDNYRYLQELKAEALHNKGNTMGRNMKHKHIIPQDAYIALPSVIRDDKKKRDEWLKEFHPYLIITR